MIGCLDPDVVKGWFINLSHIHMQIIRSVQNGTFASQDCKVAEWNGNPVLGQPLFVGIGCCSL